MLFSVIHLNNSRAIAVTDLLEEFIDFRDLMSAKISYIKSKYNQILEQKETELSLVKKIIYFFRLFFILKFF